MSLNKLSEYEKNEIKKSFENIENECWLRMADDLKISKEGSVEKTKEKIINQFKSRNIHFNQYWETSIVRDWMKYQQFKVLRNAGIENPWNEIDKLT